MEKPFLTQTKTVESAFSFEAPKPFEVPKNVEAPSESNVEVNNQLADDQADDFNPEAPIFVADESLVDKKESEGEVD